MMLAELRELLRASRSEATHDQLKQLVIDDNLLGKRTVATRKLTFQRLGELYALDPAVPLYRALRQLWQTDPQSRPMLALLVASARDPLLRSATPVVLATPLGAVCDARSIDSAIAKLLGPRLSDSTRYKVARNAASTFTQAGLLTGKVRKLRSRPVATPAALVMAMLLAYCRGLRGQRLLTADEVRLLDRPTSEVVGLALVASKQGLMTYRQLGDVVDVSFPQLISREEEELSHGRV